jgi:small-conductance mechanosensitive channel
MTKIKAWTTERRWLLLILGFIFVSLVFLGYLTRGGDSSLEYNAPAAIPNTGGLVDLTPLNTARSLASLAATPQERQYANQALNLANHEVDQAFATAVRQATAEQPTLSPAAEKLSQRITVLDAKIKGEKQNVDRLQTALPTATNQESAQEDLDEANAQLALDSNELEDLNEDFSRAGGGKNNKLQEALNSRQRIQKNEGSVTSSTAVLETPEALRTLPGKIRAYVSLNDRMKQLTVAQQNALHSVTALNQQHESLDSATQEAMNAMQNGNAAGSPGTAPNTDLRRAAISSMRKISDQHKTLVEYDKRIQDEQQLADTYKSWGALVNLQRITILHRLIRVVEIVVVLVIIAIFLDLGLSHVFNRFRVDARKLHHLRLVTALVIQVVFFGIILLVLFGPPPQLSTVIGLVTAGLTVVLKDFIVAICGWFVLIGKNGIRVGDWVEINGVAGEIVKVGLFRTVLMETGNWTAAGHPTGRRVAFFNSFAIEGQYFNFSTTGQWLWDEVRINVPIEDDLQEDTERILDIINKETGNAAQQAEKEWERSSGSYALRNFSAAPNVSVKPTGSTIEVTVRYVTSASERLGKRSRIYQKLIGALQAKPVMR